MFKMSATGPNSLIFHTKYCNNIPMNHRENRQAKCYDLH